MNDKLSKAENKASQAEEVKEKVERQLATIRQEFDDYKKNSGMEVKRLMQEIQEASQSQGKEGHDLK